MTPAEKEAYANCRANEVHLYTLELNHPAFTQPLRIVHDNTDLTAPLEDGTDALFIAMSFRMVRPPVSEEPDPSITIQVDNVSGFVTPYLELAAKSGQEITLICRPYVYDSDADTVTLLGQPLKLAVRNATTNMQNASLTAAHINPANLAFPREKYTPDRFPGLA
ncbi:DUF1833 family protein [Sansalvadorimonas verongulae]|uniref:DUF1833 family protein n=1 Tax=Sansalvadorimonas verongulae TaxID=2172824 RepID=UPI0012BD1B6A|nr:DUF1833 family protein [Sansalvadorimonas verongulae]MTI13114.1 DUF1833 domain-containing protein [Sansalvadorimonas verongulae]